jgi:hypothetical protein
MNQGLLRPPSAPPPRWSFPSAAPRPNATTRCIYHLLRQMVTYGSVTRAIPESLGYATVESLAHLPGVRCDGLLGMDLLGTAPVVWDGPEGVAIVGVSPAADARLSCVPMRLLLGSTPLVQARVGAGAGVPASCIFDT